MSGRRILGDLPAGTAYSVRKALRAASVDAGLNAGNLPRALQVKTWSKAEHRAATIEEVVYIRWGDIFYALKLEPFVTTIEAEHFTLYFPEFLKKIGWHGIAFQRYGLCAAALYYSPGFAGALIELLEGEVYLVPDAPWRSAIALAIRRDIEAQARAAREVGISTIWRMCPERVALTAQLRGDATS